MSASLFRLSINTGKADNMLMGPKLLKRRLNELMKSRKAAGRDPTPTLEDVDASHFLPFVYSFKPVVPYGNEYHDIPTAAGVPTLNMGTTQFKADVSGSFLGHSATAITLSTSYAAAAVLPTLASGVAVNAIATYPTASDAAGAVNDSTANANDIVLPDGSIIPGVEAISDGVSAASIVVRWLYELGYYDIDGQAVAAGYSVADRVAYCEFPGERLMYRRAHEVNGNTLDEYNTWTYVSYRNYHLPTDKFKLYCKCMGQEVPVEGYTNAFADGIRKVYQILNGPQTAKLIQPELQLMVPGLAWFQREYNNALPIAQVTTGMIYDKITFCNNTDLIVRKPAAYRRALVVSCILTATVSALNFDSTAGTLNFAAGYLNATGTIRGRTGRIYDYPIYTNGAITYPTISRINQYVNVITMYADIHELLINQLQFTLVTVHKSHQIGLNTATIDQSINSLKYPISQLTCGVLPDINLTSDDRDFMWHRMAAYTKTTPVGSSVLGYAFNATNLNLQGYGESLYYFAKTRTLNTLQVVIQGNDIFKSWPIELYDSFFPYAYGMKSITSPNYEAGAFIPFSANPGDQQPAGHINVSRSREFYIKGASSWVSSTNTAQLIVEADAYNFAFISENNIILRYNS